MVPGRVGAVVSHKSWPLNPQGMRPTKILPKLDVSITITTGHGHNGAYLYKYKFSAVLVQC